MTLPGRLSLVLALWGLAFAGAFAAAWLIPAGDFGFTAGLNRVGLFLGLQLAAAAIGLIAWIVGRDAPPGSAWRWLSRVPLLAAFAGLAVLAALAIGATATAPGAQPAPPPGPVTAVPRP